jgi:hypothetical protein
MLTYETVSHVGQVVSSLVSEVICLCSGSNTALLVAFCLCSSKKSGHGV